jgi:hypothetical protein
MTPGAARVALSAILDAAGTTINTPADLPALCDRLHEMARQEAALKAADDKHGATRDYADGAGKLYGLPYGLSVKSYSDIALYVQSVNDSPTSKQTWMWKLLEEVFEVGSEEDPSRICEELDDVITVCLAWKRAIKARTEGEAWAALLLSVKP